LHPIVATVVEILFIVIAIVLSIKFGLKGLNSFFYVTLFIIVGLIVYILIKLILLWRSSK